MWKITGKNDINQIFQTKQGKPTTIAILKRLDNFNLNKFEARLALVVSIAHDSIPNTWAKQWILNCKDTTKCKSLLNGNVSKQNISVAILHGELRFKKRVLKEMKIYRRLWNVHFLIFLQNSSLQEHAFIA